MSYSDVIFDQTLNIIEKGVLVYEPEEYGITKEEYERTLDALWMLKNIQVKRDAFFPDQENQYANNQNEEKLKNVIGTNLWLTVFAALEGQEEVIAKLAETRPDLAELAKNDQKDFKLFYEVLNERKPLSSLDEATIKADFKWVAKIQDVLSNEG